METLITKYKGSSLPVKVLLLVPFLVLAMLYGLPYILSREAHRRKKVDDKDKKIAKDLERSLAETFRHVGEVSRLEKEKAEQVNSIDREDPASFHNRRKK
jgi:hypothetical protein